MKGFVYEITNTVTKHKYIGSTIQTLHNRFKAHRSNARIGKKGKLYDHMRTVGIENFAINVLEDCEVDSIEQLCIREHTHYIGHNPSLNDIAPRSSFEDKSVGRIYRVTCKTDTTQFYVGSTTNNLDFRLTQHKSAALAGTTPFYTFMREHGRDDFVIECVEDNVPLDQLIVRENYHIAELKPPLNKNTNLCITVQERDRLKYLKNREKRLQQVSARRLMKRYEINAQKKVHYSANKERISAKDKAQREELQNRIVEPYTSHPGLTNEWLDTQTKFELKYIAKRLGMHRSPKLKPDLIAIILVKQNQLFMTNS